MKALGKSYIYVEGERTLAFAEVSGHKTMTIFLGWIEKENSIGARTKHICIIYNFG